MKRKRGWLLGPILILALILCAIPVQADSIPTVPHPFYGTLNIGGSPAPVDTVVTAEVGGVECGSITTTVEGEYGGPGAFDERLVVSGDIETGATIYFYAGGSVADQTYAFEPGADPTELNLTVGEVPETFTITATAGEGGSIEPSGAVVVNSGADEAFTITPETGYEIADVLVDGDSAGAVESYLFENVTADHTIDASFALQTFTITPTAGDGGSIDPSEAVEVDYGADQAFTITPETGYEIADVLVDGDSAGAVESYLFENVTADHTIDATFATTETFTITATAGEGGSIEPSGAVVVNSGADEAFTITHETGYEIADVLVDGDSAGAVESYLFENVTADHTIAASFAPTETFTITATAGEGGSIEPSGAVVVNSGASQAFTITPNTGFTVDDVLVDGDSAGAVESYLFENVTADHTIDASFAEVIDDLGDLVDEADPGDTIELEAGTYTGNVTIDKPLTITGIEGETTISGGIHIVPLVGSNVTIEYLIITDYSAYGIWIELVDTGDVFTIRNNTIEGVEGSVIGIQADNVTAGGTLDIEQNSISGNEIGIMLLEPVVAGNINFNNIVGNEVGLELLRVDHWIGASLNWWGDISGPSEANWNPGGLGDTIELPDGLSYEPWLTRDFQTVLDDNIAYFGYAWVWLYTGWNIMSTPIALDPLVEWVDSDNISRTGVDTWGNYVALGDGLSTDNTSPAYSFDAENQAWVGLTSDSPLKPCDAIYVRMASDDIAPILYSPNVSIPSKEMYSGWNLVSLAWLPPGMGGYGLPADEALVTVAEVTGDLTGYKLVVCPSVNPYESSWIYIAGDSIDPWPDPNEWPPPDDWMVITSGYWVFMLNNGTLAGFTFTPVSLPIPFDGG